MRLQVLQVDLTGTCRTLLVARLLRMQPKYTLVGRELARSSTSSYRFDVAAIVTVEC